jgi:hypothetical protein
MINNFRNNFVDFALHFNLIINFQKSRHKRISVQGQIETKARHRRLVHLNGNNKNKKPNL